jgi:hypothetical protein
VAKPKRPRDLNQLAAAIVSLATGQSSEPLVTESTAAVAGRKGGLKGGKARAERLTPAERKASAVKAARARWDRSR